jgi:hypothetical protein
VNSRPPLVFLSLSAHNHPLSAHILTAKYVLIIFILLTNFLSCFLSTQWRRSGWWFHCCTTSSFSRATGCRPSTLSSNPSGPAEAPLPRGHRRCIHNRPHGGASRARCGSYDFAATTMCFSEAQRWRRAFLTVAGSKGLGAAREGVACLRGFDTAPASSTPSPLGHVGFLHELCVILHHDLVRR